MCGIAGILGATASARAMIETLAHRGPDGIRVEEGKGWSLGHARLSIIDLAGGWQPLHAGGSTLIGVGEIYNYIELIEEFGLKGKLATGSDFEPLLHLYNLEGEKAFERLRGMYTFCLIGADGRTWLVRDPFGIKPLYFTESHAIPFGSASAVVEFSSEPRAFSRDYWQAALDDERPNPPQDDREEVLALGYKVIAGAPVSGLLALSPGSVCEVDAEGLRTRRKISVLGLPSPWRGEGSGMGVGDSKLQKLGRLAERSNGEAQSSQTSSTPNPRPFPPQGGKGEESLLAQLDAVLEDSVKVHQRSDVPYGLFLSGGIDSAAIATLMSRLNSRPVTAFTCGFDAPGAADERAKAEKVARALNLDWRETTFTEEDFWRIAPQVAWALDDPTTDYATLPTYKLAQAAKGTLTVVLSGEGGDELFGGYGRYRRALRPRWLGGRPAEPQISATFLKDGGKGALERWRQAAGHAAEPWMTPLQRAQAADIATWLPNDLLLKLDRCLMAHGLEGRTPFLDREVAAFAFNLPDKMKVRGKYGKYLLRKWLERHCPAADPWARKQGFTVPVATWIAPRAKDLGPRIAALESIQAVCKPGAVEAAFADPAQAKSWWPLLFFALWSRIHLEGAEPGDALKSLGVS